MGRGRPFVDPDEVQARVQLSAFLFKEAVRGLADGLRLLNAPPVRPDEKEQLLAAVEKAVWAFPASIFLHANEDDWEERAAESPLVREALEAALDPVLLARRPPPPA
jgi:hypothetical protein